MEDRIRHFLRFLSLERGAAENTVDAYRTDLLQFYTGLSPLGLNGGSDDWRRISRDVIVSYISELKERRYAEATVARKVAAMKSFFQYLHAEGIIRHNPTESLESTRVGKSLPKAISVREVDELLEQPAKRKTPQALRDQAMLELMYATGLRVTELVSLDLDSISLQAQSPCVRCVGKGARERTIPIRKRALRTLASYLSNGRQKLVGNKKGPALFVNRRGNRLTRQGFWVILKGYAQEAGIEVTPHTLRHTFATHTLRAGTSLRTVQELLGHSSISTTRVYTQIADYDVPRPRRSPPAREAVPIRRPGTDGAVAMAGRRAGP